MKILIKKCDLNTFCEEYNIHTLIVPTQAEYFIYDTESFFSYYRSKPAILRRVKEYSPVLSELLETVKRLESKVNNLTKQLKSNKNV